jgi:hypothetical protein
VSPVPLVRPAVIRALLALLHQVPPNQKLAL